MVTHNDGREAVTNHDLKSAREPLGAILVYPVFRIAAVHNWMISAQSRT